MSYVTGVKGLEKFDAAVSKAHQNPGQVVKVGPGWYVVEIDCDMVEIKQRIEGEGSFRMWWDCHQVNYKWTGDPMPTLRETKESLGIE